jgi:nicotinate-nucleotide adenylyltransferase
LSEINARHPEAELTFIVGADTALTLASWHEPRTVLRLARLAVAGRPGSSEAEVRNTVEGLASSGERAGISFLAMKPTAVSSSLARSRIAAGMPVDDLLAGDVAEYVAAHGLYGAMPREAS